MLDFLAEQKLEEAVSRGELDDLPGQGRPLELDDDRLIPEELRVAYRILKNAGYVPPELQELNEIVQLEPAAALGRLRHVGRAVDQRHPGVAGNRRQARLPPAITLLQLGELAGVALGIVGALARVAREVEQ